MSLTIPKTVAAASEHDWLRNKAETARYGGDQIHLADHELTEDVLTAISHGATQTSTAKIKRIADAIQAARSGDTDVLVPSLPAAPELFRAYLRSNLRDGWIYIEGTDGHHQPWLVEKIGIVTARNPQDRDHLAITLVANGRSKARQSTALGVTRTSLTFEGSQIARKKVSDILAKANILIETEALRADYDAAAEHYFEVLNGGFTNQYRFNGQPNSKEDGYGRANERATKVVHDLSPKEIGAPSEFAESAFFATADTDDSEDAVEGLGSVPTHFDVRVFDLATHEFLWVNARDMVAYEYDKTLRDKIVLPEDQRNLLDILTHDIGEFTGDVIEGKSTGNVILAKGVPGVGKTLTAEIYSELIERPLYSIHSGTLGTSAESVRTNLETVFKRAKRWGAVLLLDEADVFVLERGTDIAQNAIVAEFLRTLEYFDGLMFMTTNRAKNIDDAIQSRAAAIIDYKIPSTEGIREVWNVQATLQGVTLNETLLNDLVTGFADITPRDVKMLLRLAIRIAKGNNHTLDIDTFARCGMFRGLHYQPDSRRAENEPEDAT